MASRPGALSGSFSAAPGKRPVSAALRVMGLGQTEHFQRYRSVLNRAVWSVREVSHVLLGVLVRTFVPSGPLVIGVDEALERRWGKKIAAKGIYRDPVRSTQERIVKSSGLRGICLMLLVPVPWAGRVWALPFLSVLAPSERYAAPRRSRSMWACSALGSSRGSSGRRAPRAPAPHKGFLC
jgi:DDE superfamily endonuclease